MTETEAGKGPARGEVTSERAVTVCVMVPEALITALDREAHGRPRGRSAAIRRVLDRTARLSASGLHSRADATYRERAGVGDWRSAGERYLSFTLPPDAYTRLKQGATLAGLGRSVYVRGRLWAGVGSGETTGPAQ